MASANLGVGWGSKFGVMTRRGRGEVNWVIGRVREEGVMIFYWEMRNAAQGGSSYCGQGGNDKCGLKEDNQKMTVVKEMARMLRIRK